MRGEVRGLLHPAVVRNLTYKVIIKFKIPVIEVICNYLLMDVI